MMKITMAMAWLAVLPGLVATAAPAAKSDPVAEGFVDWQGVCPKNYITGREITASDLRHKVTIVVEVEPNPKLQDDFANAVHLATKTGLIQGTLDLAGDPWETAKLPRHTIVIFSVRGAGKNHEAVMRALSVKDPEKNRSLYGVISTVARNGTAFYDNVTFAGAPEIKKRPYFYVMGPTGKEPIVQGELVGGAVAKVSQKINDAISEVKDMDPPWKPFYGTVGTPKYHPQLAKTLAKGGSLEALSKGVLLKDIASKDAEKSKEAQVLFDAINQTRSDLEYTVQLTMADCPHRAYYDLGRLMKFWPSEKKRLESTLAKVKTSPEVEPMAKMYAKIIAWSDPDFTCKSAREAKQIVGELGKMKKTLAKLKESSVVVVQNGAMILDMKADELMSAVPSRVAAK